MREGTQYKSREDMEYHFKWVRKHFYTDLLKVFLAKDVDDYNDYKFDLYYNFHSLDILKYDEIGASEKFIKCTLLRCFDLEKIVEQIVDYYNKRNDKLFNKYDTDGDVQINDMYYITENIFIPKNISLKDFEKDKFVSFVNSYIDWITNELIKCGDVSFYKVNKITDELLDWNEHLEYRKKRALQTAKENRFNQSCEVSLEAQIILGECFIELFHKLYNQIKKKNKLDTLNEMQFLFDYVSKTVYTNGKEPLLDGEIRDRFLTAGATPEDVVEMNREEIVAYDKFSTYLLFYKSVQKAFDKVEIEIE